MTETRKPDNTPNTEEVTSIQFGEIVFYYSSLGVNSFNEDQENVLKMFSTALKDGNWDIAISMINDPRLKGLNREGLKTIASNHLKGRRSPNRVTSTRQTYLSKIPAPLPPVGSRK